VGLLSLGTPLHWDQAKHYADHVRYHGITQFLNIWDRLKDRQGDELLWGDEVLQTPLLHNLPPLISRPLQVEYMIVQLDDDAKDAVLSLCQTDILAKLQALSKEMEAKAGSS
jgi:glutamate--cysteine ligase catalytic subunit